MASRDRVSVAVVTFNEERNIAECLESAAWADEVIVVDSFSTDRTVEISRRYTERVIQRPWPGFGKQKNFAVSQAQMEWTFVLDADERIPADLRREVEGILEAKDRNFSAYRLARKNYFYGHWLKRGGLYPDWQTRLFRRGAAVYDDTEPHENLILTGPLGTLSNPLIHITERSISDHFPKLNHYSSLYAGQRVRTCKKVHLHDLFFRPMIAFFQLYVAKQGFRDGIPGLIQATLRSLYTFVKYAKVWELHQKHEKDGKESR